MRRRSLSWRSSSEAGDSDSFAPLLYTLYADFNGNKFIAMTPPSAFFKTYLMCDSAAPPPQHLRKPTLYCKPPTIEPRHDLYIPKNDLKDGRNYFSFAFNCTSYC